MRWRHSFARCLSSALALLCFGSLASALTAEELSVRAQQQMRWLLQEKASVRGDAGKLDSALRWALQSREGRGVALALPAMRVLKPDDSGRFHVDVQLHSAAQTSAFLEWLLTSSDAVVESTTGDELRAWVPAQNLNALTARSEVRRIRRAMAALRSNTSSASSLTNSDSTSAVNISEGLRAHRVDVLRNNYGLTGLGQKICVLSDSVDDLGNRRASDDVRQPVAVLPGQSGLGFDFSGEGTAMLEIVSDLAPDAPLGFATAFTGVAAFAQNVRDLRFVAGCDVLVDDIFYFNESPFQDGPIAQAVNEVTAAGALYFSAAGNEGSLDKGTSGVFEGDFVDAGVLAALPGGSVMQFVTPMLGSSNQIRVLSNGFGAALHWSDALGASSNDYDIFVMSPDLQNVLDAGMDLQDGDDDPFELTGPIFLDDRIVVWKSSTAAPRFLHVNGLRARFNLATSGQTKGHAAAVDAFSVAAVDKFWAQGGAFNPSISNPVEPFSADGPRRMFYAANGDLLNAGNPSLLADGGVLRAKPDLAAADGVSTATPGFAQFFGTSAAAPHVAAIAALLRQAAPDSTPAQIRQALVQTAMDIEAPGPDILSGAGIVVADAAAKFLGVQAAAQLSRGALSLSEFDGDGDLTLEPGETFELQMNLHNVGAANAAQIKAQLQSSTPGLELLRAEVEYAPLAPTAMATGLQAFRFRLAPNFDCGRRLEFGVSVIHSGASPGITGYAVQRFTLTSGTAGTEQSVSFDGPARTIPDNDAVGISIDLPVATAGARVADLRVQFDGEACSDDFFATTVGLQHSFIGDLQIDLQTPSGSLLRLLDRPRVGTGDNSGNHLCQLRFDDAATFALADAIPTLAPFTGSFRAVDSLSSVAGESADGLWRLHLRDRVAQNTGQLRNMRLLIQPASCDVHVAERLHVDGFE